MYDLYTRPNDRPRLDRARTALGLVGATVGAAVCLLGALPSPATASVANSRTAQVNVGDLNLSRPAGRKTLALRLRSAARAVCPSHAGSLAGRAAAAACLRTIRVSPLPPGTPG